MQAGPSFEDPEIGSHLAPFHQWCDPKQVYPSQTPQSPHLHSRGYSILYFLGCDQAYNHL